MHKMKPFGYRHYRYRGLSILESFVLGTPLWYWLIGFPFLANMLLWGAYFLTYPQGWWN